MTDYIPPNVTCTACNGSGEIDGVLCQSCFGQGTFPLKDIIPQILKELADMRADLTTALTAIWNKVKDL